GPPPKSSTGTLGREDVLNAAPILYVLWEDHGNGGESTPADILFARTTAPTQLSMMLSANQAAFRPGQPATVAVTASNPGPSAVMDVCFGVALPMAAGPLYGCSGVTAPMLSFVWPGGLPAGTYHFFLTVTPPGGFATGNVASATAVDLNYAP